MIVLKEPKATKYSDHCKNSLITHTAKIVAWILRRIERKIEGVLGDQFEVRRRKGTTNATGTLRIILEQTLDIN
jgi:hypothetical protein